MQCQKCEEPAWYKMRDLVIDDIKADHRVKAGDSFHIFVKVKSDTWLFARTGKLCVYEGNNVLAQSSNFIVDAREFIDVVLSGTMPDRDLYLNVSLMAEEWGIVDCEDGQEVYIPVGTTSDPYNPQDEPEEPQDLAEWIQENLVLILLLILVIIIIIKFG